MNTTDFISDRRWTFVILNAFLLTFSGILMIVRISAHGWTIAAAGLFLLFLILQAQIVYGFTLAVTGWWLLRHGGDPVRINQTLPQNAVPGRLPATAILIPIFNEDVGRVFQGLRVMYESLRAMGRNESFDFFILSDSSDLSVWIAEEKAWFDLCRQVHGFGHIFYRKRRVTLHHKSGNVADFCRRWGTRYRYMIVLDADSVMAGGTFVRLVNLMENHPQTGIIQTYSRPVLGQSLFQRINQFASQVYGPLFVAGANFWQLDNASWYGHNAIIRVDPFMRFCAMPELPPSGKLGTRIMSHDTVEAALIRRAGCEVWSDYDLGGSFEEGPPHLPASLQRDRRWCHGNMQHIWFLFSRGLTLPSRVNILIGIMAYLSSPLWLLFLLFSPVLFIGGRVPVQNTFLFVFALCLLFIPKVLAAQYVMASSERRKAAGGGVKMLLSTLGESAYSMILAPILMLFYTQFVWSSFFGGFAGWGKQKRTDDTGPSWRECVMVHAAHTAVAIAAGVLVGWLLPAMLPWLMLVLIGPVVSIPFSYLMASNRLGLAARRHGWFLIPEEMQPPPELEALQQPLESPDGIPAGNFAEDSGLARIVLDPRLNALHVSLLRERLQVPSHAHERLLVLCDRLLEAGPSALPPRDKKILMWDADSIAALHQKLWSSPLPLLHPSWQEAFHEYLDHLAASEIQPPVSEPANSFA
ncbi:MAG: glucans biosynthesis glucosyltransferase MdoH [Verrucomicrobiota bacterium]|jgi:membrane glycosyltransferase